MLRVALTLLLLPVLASLLTACGGGGGSENDTPPPSGYTAEQRSRITGDVAQKYEDLLAAGHPAPWEALEDYARSRPEFVEAGVGRNSLWARFRDGRYFLYVDNWRPVTGEALPAPAETSLAAMPQATAVAAEQEVPGSERALLLKLQGEEFAPGDASLSRAASALKSRGWQVSPDRELSVDGLKGRGSLGLVYLNSHAGTFGPSEHKRYAFITQTQSTDRNEEIFAADIADGSLVYTRTRNAWNYYHYGRHPHYAVTSTFVRKYLSFSPDSLVLLMMCEGGSDEAREFRDALTARGAGTVIGWNGPANELGYRTLDVLLDRLTGMNAVLPPQPPNRAFNFSDVWHFLEERQLVINPPSEPGGQPSFIKRFGSGFDLSNPVITGLRTAYPDQLHIHGDFGTVPGSVTIGGTAVPSTWAEDGSMIAVNLPTDAGDPAGSVGDVVVTARGRRSNVRTLTSWRGQVQYLYEELPDTINGEAGILSNQITVNLHLRGDAHALRTSVDGPLLDNPWNMIPASDTFATWSANGTRTAGGHFFDRWSGSGSLSLKWPLLPTQPEFMLTARIHPVKRRIQLLPAFAQASLVSTVQEGMSPLLMDYEFLGFNQEGGTGLDYEPLPSGTNLPLDARMNVPASQQVMRPDDRTRITVKWTAMTANPPLKDEIGR